METKANYLLIGVFTLASIFGAFALFVWLAKVNIDQQYAYFDVLFEDVSGLGNAGDVRYNGLPVGQVVDLQLDEEDSSQVRVTIEVRADTPINTETVATLQAQGVTGVSYVGLSGGGLDSEPLPEGSVIPSKRSALQSVFEGAPLLLDRAVALLEDVNEVFDEQNRQAISDILSNLSDASARLDTTLSNFEVLSEDLGAAAREVSAFSNRLSELADTAEVTLNTATQTLETAETTFEKVNEFTETDLPRIVEGVDTTLQTAERVIDTVGTDVARAVDRLEELAETGTSTLDAATETFGEANQTLETVSQAMVSAEETLETAKQTFASANDILENDIDGMITDLRGAVTSFTDTVEAASDGIDEVTVEVKSASQSAATFLAALEDLVQDNRRQISDFLGLGLPEFLKLTEESRALVTNLDRLVNRFERDPARFLLGTTSSEFSR